ncbi:MAG: multicopper oxidase family protein [Methanobacteriota archaeon]
MRGFCTDPRLGFVAIAVSLVVAGCTGAPPGPDPGPAREGTLREFDLYVAECPLEPVPGRPLFGLGFSFTEGGPCTIPGPEIRVREGDHVVVRFHNGHHTVHWHGYAVPWAMDGVPYMAQGLVGGDAVYVYEFDARETGTYWYHCHVDVPVHIDWGMFGAFIVEPSDPAADPPYGREHTLFLHEADSVLQSIDAAPRPPESPNDVPEYAARVGRQALASGAAGAEDTSGNHSFSEGPRPYYPAVSTRYRPQYDTFIVNGKSYPYGEDVRIRTGETLRLRVVNAGQLVHTMHLHGHHALVTHKDGYRLGSPYAIDTLLLGPGERYDLYLRGDNPGVWDFHDHGGAWGVGAYAATDHAFPGGMNTRIVYDDLEEPPLPEPTPERGARRHH